MRLPGRVVVPGSAGSENVGPLREVIGGQFEPGLKWGAHRGSNGSVDWATASMSSWAVPPPKLARPGVDPGAHLRVVPEPGPAVRAGARPAARPRLRGRLVGKIPAEDIHGTSRAAGSS